MKKHWVIAFTFSFVFHAFILSGTSSIFKNQPKIKKDKKFTKKIEINPEKIERIKNKPKILPKIHQPQPLPYVEKIMGKLIEQRKLSNYEKPHLFEKSVGAIILKEPADESSLKEDPSYMDYYRIIREKIRANTFNNYDTSKQGQIFASFKVFKDGTIEGIDLMPKKADNKSLRRIAHKSIKNAAPMPTFPPEFKAYRYLPFTLTMYFEK